MSTRDAARNESPAVLSMYPDVSVCLAAISKLDVHFARRVEKRIALALNDARDTALSGTSADAAAARLKGFLEELGYEC